MKIGEINQTDTDSIVFEQIPPYIIILLQLFYSLSKYSIISFI